MRGCMEELMDRLKKLKELEALSTKTEAEESQPEAAVQENKRQKVLLARKKQLQRQKRSKIPFSLR